MGALTTMTSKGQITIPSKVREALNLQPGTRFYVSARNGQIIVIPKNRKLVDFAGILGKPPSGAILTIEEMNQAVIDAATEDDARIMREWSERQT